MLFHISKVEDLLKKNGISIITEEELAESKKDSDKSSDLTKSENNEEKSQEKKPLETNQKIGRNEKVTITKGSESKVMKYKKVQPMLEDGWTLSV